jgi:hypothetical protein
MNGNVTDPPQGYLAFLAEFKQKIRSARLQTAASGSPELADVVSRAIDKVPDTHAIRRGICDVLIGTRPKLAARFTFAESGDEACGLELRLFVRPSCPLTRQRPPRRMNGGCLGIHNSEANRQGAPVMLNEKKKRSSVTHTCMRSRLLPDLRAVKQIDIWMGVGLMLGWTLVRSWTRTRF